MNIKNTTRLDVLLKEYPQLERNIIQLMPQFDQLQQSTLREAVLNITSLEHLALKAGVEVNSVVADFRRAVGMTEDEPDAAAQIQFTESDPEWIKTKPKHILDGVEMLSRGEHPLGQVTELSEQLKSGEVILLKTNFRPQPLIDAMTEKQMQVFSRTTVDDPNSHITFFGKA